jgi:alkylation response protein AidB-like acyl-CoA dehydrogenase
VAPVPPEAELEEFRARAREFLDVHAPAKGSPEDFSQGYYSEDPEAERAYIARNQWWQGLLAEHGWACLTWPKEFGGQGLTSLHARVFAQESARYGVSTGAFSVGIGMFGPTMIAHGTPEQQARFLPGLLHGRDIWCQLFSEPGAGSDLAGLRTRAERDGDELVVNGQKVWNSGAHLSQWGILLARTDWDVPKHKGITYLLVDMRTPGVECRPLKQITGSAHFNEVFLTDVRIPVANVLGAVNDGWRVAQTTLANERTMIGGSGGGAGGSFKQLVQLAQERGAAADPVVRQGIAEAYTRGEILRYLGLKVQQALMAGRQPGPEASIMKILIGQHLERTAVLALSMEGAAAALVKRDAPVGGIWQNQLLSHYAVKFGGGTEQIQRNVIGERVLGLPGDIRVDKDGPFREVAGIG